MEEDTIATILALVIAIFMGPLIVMVCWNAVVPAVFGLISITYKQSFCLYLLARFLFGSVNKKS